MAVTEARLERTEHGLEPADEGWFTVNVRHAAWVTGKHFGSACVFEGKPDFPEDEERRLRAWDFLHCPAGTRHILVGAGDGPCLVFMAGARDHPRSGCHCRSEVALRHGAGVEAETSDPKQAYAPFPGWRPGPPSFDGLPFG